MQFLPTIHSPHKKPADKWQKLTDKASRFSIEMPGIPEKHNGTGTPLPDPLWTCVEKSPVALYYISAGVRKGSDLSAANDQLKKRKEEIAKEFPGQAVFVKHLSIGGYPGAEYRLEGKDGMSSRMRFYFIKGYEYNLAVNADRKYINSDRFERFFKSFTVSAP